MLRRKIMNNTQTNNVVKDVKETKKIYDFSKKASELKNKNFCDYDFKNDYVLSIRLSYGDEKQKESVYNEYVKFLKDDLKILNEKNEIEKNTKKQGSYYFAFKKTSEYNNYFNQLKDYIKENDEKLKDDENFKNYIDLLKCSDDLKNENFTIANFELIKDKTKNFIEFCIENELIEK